MLVDCGSSNSYISAGDVAADYFLSAGIRRLDAVVLTHYHADHANGLALLLARVGVDTLYLPDIAEENGEKTAVLALSERYGVEVRYVTAETQAAPTAGTVMLSSKPSSPAPNTRLTIHRHRRSSPPPSAAALPPTAPPPWRRSSAP